MCMGPGGYPQRRRLDPHAIFCVRAPWQRGNECHVAVEAIVERVSYTGHCLPRHTIQPLTGTGVMKICTPRKYGHPGVLISRDFRHPVVIIRTPSACKRRERYGDRDDAYDAGGYSHADVKTYQVQNGQV